MLSSQSSKCRQGINSGHSKIKSDDILFDDVWITLAASCGNSTLNNIIRDFDIFIAGLLLQNLFSG